MIALFTGWFAPKSARSQREIALPQEEDVDARELIAALNFIERSQNSAAAARNWRITALVFAVSTLLSGGAAFHLSQRIIPVVKEVVSQDGKVLSVTFPRTLLPPEIEHNAIVNGIGTWIENRAAVYRDWEATRKALQIAYAFTSGSAFEDLNKFLATRKPQEIAQQSIQRVGIPESIDSLDREGKSWLVRWRQEETSPMGKTATCWEAMLQIQQFPSYEIEEIQKNPLGYKIISSEIRQRPICEAK